MEKPVILVVEDNEIQRKVINLLCGEFGYQAVLAADCAEACDAFSVGGDIYKLVLMDFILPDDDGSACTMKLREIERQRAGQRVPVVAMTGYININDHDRCVGAGFDDCLIKPFSSKEFRAMVEKWVKGSAAPETDNVRQMTKRQSGTFNLQ